MQRIFLIIATLFVSHLCFSQDRIFILHPFVGDTIDRFEKAKFLLFPEVNDSSFCYGQIHSRDSKYLLNSYATHNSTPRIDELDSLTINEYYMGIQKLIDYYTTFLKSDSAHKSFSAFPKSPTNINLNISPEFLKKLTYEMIRYQSLKWSAEQRGLQGAEQDNFIKTSGYWGNIK